MQKQLARCRKCHRKLTNADAIVIGYGPVCYRKLNGISPKATSASAQNKTSRSYRPRKVAGHQISFFDEEVSYGSLDQQTAR